MKRPERDENSETEQQQWENELLRAQCHRHQPEAARHLADVESRGQTTDSGVDVENNQANQREQRVDAEIQRDLERRVILLLTASPHANHDERRDEREFVEEVKEK